MQKSKTQEYNAAAFKTVEEFREMHNIDKKDKTTLFDAATALFKQNKQVKNPSGNLVPAIRRNKASHNGRSPYLINPLAHDMLLKEIENQKRLATRNAKGTEK